MFDVNIVGASVSGLIIAQILSKKDINVLVVEKEGGVGKSHDNKVDVAEVNGLEKYVKELDLKPVCVTYNSWWHSSNHSFELKLKGEDSYFFRRGLSEDSIENQLARDIKEKIRFGAELVAITRKNDCYEVAIKQNNRKEKLKAKVVVGADGVNSQVAKLCGFPEQQTRRIVGYGVNLTGGGFEACIPEVYFDVKYLPGGYLYVAPCPDGTTTAVGVIDPLKAEDPKVNFNSFIKSNPKFKDIKIVNEIHGEGVISGPRKQTVRDNISLVGDAAHIMDPCFGFGLKNAIITGCIAGEVINKALEEDDLRLLNDYEARWQNEIGAQLKNGIRLRKIIDRLENKDFDFVIESLNKLKKKGLDFDEVFKNLSYSRHLPLVIGTMLKKPSGSMRLISKYLRK